LAYVLARFFGDSSGYFFLFWIPEYLITVKHFSFTMVGTLAWIPFLCNDIGPVSGGYASSLLVRAGSPPLFARKFMMTIASTLVAAGILLQSATQTWAVLSALSLSTFGVGVWAGNLHALPADAFPPRSVATAYGLAGSAGAVGGILFNTLVGYFSAQSNYFTVFIVLLLLEPLGVLALWIWLRDRREPTGQI
jgi:ACS family hexuronate transporter-like MFS transporter